MKRVVRKIGAACLSFAMLFSANMPTVLIAEDVPQESTPEPIEEEKEETPVETEGTGAVSDGEPVVTVGEEPAPEVVPTENTPEPADQPSTEPAAEQPVSETPAAEDVQPTEQPEEKTEPETAEEPDVSYQIIGVFQADDGQSVESELNPGEDPVSVSELAQPLAGYTWNGNATITRPDNTVDTVTAISGSAYVVKNDTDGDYTVSFDDAFGSENTTVYVVFAYTKDIVVEEPESEPEPAYEHHFEFENHRVHVTADAHEGAEIPEGSELHADYLVPGSSAYRTAVAAILAGTDADPDKTEFELYDIYFTHEGNRIEPNDNVDVTLSFKRTVAPKKDNGEIADAEVVHVDNDNNGEVVSQQNVVTSDSGIEEISFTNDSFSPYGVKYTVDYTYSGYTWSMEGGTEIYLSELFGMLGIPEDAANVTGVEFTNYDLISVEQTEGNWILKSLKPFDTSEVLTVTMANGDKYIIDVTDAGESEIPLISIANNFSISVEETAGGQVDLSNLDRNASFQIKVSYEIPNDKVETAIANNVWTYNLNSLISESSIKAFGDITGTEHPIMFNGTIVGYYNVTNGVVSLHITNPQDIPPHDVKGYFTLGMSLDASEDKAGESETFVFPGGGTLGPVTYKENHHNATKSIENRDANSGGNSGNEMILEKDENGNYIAHYKLWFQPGVNVSSLVLNDTLGEGQTLNSPVTIKNNSGQSAEVAVTSLSNWDVYTAFKNANLLESGDNPKMKAGENYYIEYTTTIRADQVGKNITNTSSWTINGKDTTPGGDTNFVVKKASDVKKTVAVSGEGADTTYTYTITLGDSNIDYRGHTIKDVMNDLQIFQGTSVEIKNAGGSTVATVDVNPEAYDTTYADRDLTLFMYTFPNGATAINGPLTITYQTKVAAEADVKGWHDVKNTTTDETTGENGSASKPYQFEGVPQQGTITKAWNAFDTTKEPGKNLVEWIITVDKTEDQEWPLTNVIVQESNYYEKIGSGNQNQLKIRWDISTFTVNGTSVTPVYYDYWQSKETSVESANSVMFESLNGPLTIHLFTESQDDFENGYYAYNDVNLYVNSKNNGNAWADKRLNTAKVSMVKSGNYIKEKDEYVWTVIINPDKAEVSPDVKPVRFVDVIPEGMELSASSDNNWTVWDGSSNCPALHVWIDTNNTVAQDGSSGGYIYPPIALTDPERIDVDISTDTGLSGHTFVLQYKTKVKDGVAPTITNQTLTFTNNASITDEGGKVIANAEDTVTETYKFIEKNDVSGRELPADIIRYKVICNPDAADLSEGEDTLTLTDTLSTDVELVLKSDHSVKVYDENGNPVSDSSVSYNDDSRTLTVKIPDQAYRMVEFEVQVKRLGTATFSNTVYLKGDRQYSDSTEEEHIVNRHSAGIEGANNSVFLKKVDENNITKPIPGAVFNLYKVTYGPDYKKTGETKIEGDFVSDETGLVRFEGIIQPHVVYYWVEVSTPPPYKIGDNAKPHYFVMYENSTDYETAKEIDHKYQEANEGATVLTVKDKYLWTATNVEARGSLKVEKTVQGGPSSATTKSFEITITDSKGKYVKADGTLSDTEVKHTFMNGTTLQIDNLPLGDYTVTELETDATGAAQISGYTLEVTGTGVAKIAEANTRDNPATATVTNKYTQNDVSTTIIGNKTLNGRNMADGEFSFTIEGQDNAPMPVTTTVTSKGAMSGAAAEDFEFGPITYSEPGVYTYTVKEDIPDDAHKLPGITYDNSEYTVIVTVERDTTTGSLSVSKEYKKGTETAEKASFENEFDATDLKLKKEVAGNGDDPVGSFAFTVKLTDAAGQNLTGVITTSIEGTSGTRDYTLNNGTFQVSLQKDQVLVIRELPVGTKYSITETDYSAQGYETEWKINAGEATKSLNAQGTVSAEVDTVTYTNTRNTVGSLVVTKTTKGNSGDKTKKFSFTVTLNDNTINSDDEHIYKGTASDVDITFTNGEATFELSDGQKAEIVNLPTGTTYEVTENSDGYESSIKDNDPTNYSDESEKLSDGKGTIRENIISKTDFTNVLDKYGAFSVVKKTAGNNGDKKTWFAYQIILIPEEGVTLEPGTYGNVTFKTDPDNTKQLIVDGPYYTSGVDQSKVDIDARDRVVVAKNEVVKIWGVPAGTTYKVIEDTYTAYDSQEYTNMSDDGVIVEAQVGADQKDSEGAYSFDGTKQVTITNTRNKFGNLGIYKSVTGNVTDSGKSFAVTVTLTDSAGNPVSGTFSDGSNPAYTFDETGKCVVQVTDSDYTDGKYDNASGGILITGLPVGTHFTVTETETGYTPTYIQTVMFERAAPADYADKQISGEGITDTPLQVNEKYHYTIAEGETIHGISSSGKVEDEAQEYGLIQNHQHNVLISNEKWSYGALVVEKQVEGTVSTDQLFTFDITVDDTSEGLEAVIVDSTGAAQGESVPLTNGKATVQLKAGQKAVIVGLKTGANYSVEETNIPKSYTSSGTNTTGTIAELSSENPHGLTVEKVLADTKATKSVFTNTYHVGTLTVSKRVIGNNASTNDKFIVAVALYGDDIDADRVKPQDKDGNPAVDADGNPITFALHSTSSDGNIVVAEFTILPDQPISLYNLPSGVNYIAAEDKDKLPEGYKWVNMYAEETLGVIPTETEGAAVAVLVNQKDTNGSFKLKKVTSGNADDPNDVFKFTITLSDSSISGNHGTEEKSVNFTAGVSEDVSLVANEEIEVTGIPYGTTYTITETDNKGYTSKQPANYTGVINAENDSFTVEWENTRNINGTLKLKKTVTGNSGDKAKNFKFTITLLDALEDLTGTKVFGGVTFTDGVSEEILLQDGNSKELTGLPVCNYSITEENEDYTTTFVKKGGTATVSGDYETAITGQIDPYESLVDAEGDNAELNKQLSQEIEVTNSLDVFGGLEVSKVVQGNAADDQSFPFSLTITNKNGTPFTGTVSASTSVDGGAAEEISLEFDAQGKATFNLSNGQKLTIPDKLPSGARYEVVETDHFTYTPSYDSYRTGTIKPLEEGKVAAENKTVITNTRNTYGKLTIKKTVSGNAVADETETLFAMNVTVYKSDTFTAENIDTSVNGQLGIGGFNANFVNGTAVVQLKASMTDGGTIDKLPNGDYVFIDEADYTSSGYDAVTYDSGTSGTNHAGKTGVYFPVSGNGTLSLTATNNRDKPSIKITKTFAGDELSDADKDKVKFVVTGPNNFRQEFTYADMKGTGYKTIENLTPGATYTISETNATVNGYALSTTYKVGSDSPAETCTVTMSNTDHKEVKEVEVVNTYARDKGTLRVVKALDGAPAGNTNKVFRVTIQRTDDNQYLNADGSLTTEKTELTVTQKTPLEIENVPVGEYKVTELSTGRAITNYTFNVTNSVTESTATVEKEALAIANLKNSYDQDKGNLKVTKTVQGVAADTSDKVFTIVITDSSGQYLQSDGSLTNSQQTITISDNQTVEINDIPVGAYTVRELSDGREIDKYTLNATRSTTSGSVSVAKNATGELALVNVYEREKGSLKVKKTVEGAPETEADKKFKIAVKGDDGTYYKQDGSAAKDKNAAWVEFTADQELEWKNLPTGSYTVEEDEGSAQIRSYSLTVDCGDAVEVTATDTAQAEVKNTYTQSTGSLKVSKTVKSNDKNDKTKDFKFKVILNDKTVAGTFGDMTFKDGVAEFTLKDGESKTATGLLSGVKYTVEEEKADGFTVTKTGDTGTIAADKTAEAKFTNTKDTPPTPTPGPKIDTRQVRVVKAWKDGDNAGGTRPASVTVHLLADGVDTGLTVQLSAANNWNYVWYDLPVYTSYGNIISYSVAEDPVPGYTADYSGSMNSGYTITNKKRVIPKTDDTFEALKLQAILLGSMLMAMLSSFLLRKTAER